MLLPPLSRNSRKVNTKNAHLLILLGAFCCCFFHTGMASTWELNFEDTPAGEWIVPDQNPLFRHSNPEIKLEILEPGVSPLTSGNVLCVKGPKRGFRNIKPMEFVFYEGKISFDFALFTGSFNFFLMESPVSTETRRRGIRFSVDRQRNILTYQTDRNLPPIIHGKIETLEPYRVEVSVRLHASGGGTYDLRVIHLTTNEELPLTDATDLPVSSEVTSLAGIDIDLSSTGSELHIDNVIFTESGSLAP